MVGKRIVYLGSEEVNATYIFEEEEGETGSLKVKRKLEGIDYVRGSCDSPFSTFEERIYFVPWDKRSQVFCLDQKY